MVYLVPIILAIVLFLYNYRKLIVIKKFKKEIMSSPNESTNSSISRELSEFKIEMVQRLTVVETTMRNYLGTTGILGLLLIGLQIYSMVKSAV